MPHSFPRFAAVLALLLFATGCSSNRAVSLAVSPQTAFVGSGQNTQFTATGTESNSAVTWAVNGVAGGTATTGTIDASGDYSAPSVTQNATATVTATSAGKSASAAVSIVAPGVVTTTNEPQVAQYTIDPPASANVSIEFGTDTSYGKTTWTQPTPTGGGPVSIYVAGMLANTLYHMRAVIQFTGSNTVDDSDQTFTTGSLTPAMITPLTATTTAGMTPQNGVELLDLTAGQSQYSVLVTELAGNALWGYSPGPNLYSNGVKQLPNGDFLTISTASSAVDGTGSVINEVDLGGNVVWSMTAAQLNAALAAATCAGCNITVIGNHHDVAALPNGHLVLIASEENSESGLTGEPSPVTVDGDVLIDLDQNHKPDWVWSEFDHLDLNRHPLGLPDWTHTNAVVYSPDDKDLIVSIRNQSWIVKIDYDDGQGTGNILWKLGYQGNFTLMNGTDPVDWQYAQHDANVASSNSSGVFQVMMFDNGNNRVMDDSGDICGTSGQPACYSRVPIFQLDETAKTATIEWVDDLSPTFSSWGGNGRLLANGDIEFDECDLGSNSTIFEVTKTAVPEVVWQMQIPTTNAYRGYRLPSMYPGVQW
ncbi:MAG: aryl-sulfate sulfotransferase [Candidatus Acidiferrales bacterium]